MIEIKLIPDIVGLRIPSPITMLVPRRTTRSRTTRELRYFSKNCFMSKLVRVSAICSSALSIDTCSSVTLVVFNRPILECRQSNEYKAKVPPTKSTLYVH